MPKSTIDAVRELVAFGKVRISEHGRDELAADGIALGDLLHGVAAAKVVEDYPDYYKGPSVLCLQHDEAEQPLHALWGIAAHATDIATLITAYRPDPDRWTDDFMTRKRR